MQIFHKIVNLIKKKKKKEIKTVESLKTPCIWICMYTDELKKDLKLKTRDVKFFFHDTDVRVFNVRICKCNLKIMYSMTYISSESSMLALSTRSISYGFFFMRFE